MALADRAGGCDRRSLRGAGEIVGRGRLDPREPWCAPLTRLIARLGRPVRDGADTSGPRDRSPRRCRHPGACSRSAAVLAVLGWVADTQTAVQSDVTKLVPSNMPALRDLHALEQVTGVSGEIDVTVHAHERGDAADGRLDDLLREQAADALRLPRDQGLRARDPVPGAVAAGPVLAPAAQPTQNALLGPQRRRRSTACWPPCRPYFSQAVITPDHREATLAFGIRLMPLSRQQRVIDYMRSQLHPPAGVDRPARGPAGARRRRPTRRSPPRAAAC